MTTTDRAVAYEVVFDCRDRSLGLRLCERLEQLVALDTPVVTSEEGPTWAVTLEFPDTTLADAFFEGPDYERYCTEVRRACRSPVLVVPLGPR